MKHILLLLFTALLLPFSVPETDNSCRMRAMLIGSDTFITQENTYPIARNNLHSIQSLLQSDVRTYQDIGIWYETISDPQTLSDAMDSFFAATDENDISLFYFSTHGILSENTAGLYLSDGTTESLLDPQTLSSLLSAIPGKKILLLDACNSGAFIEKGTDNLLINHPFTEKDIYVITSAGGFEASWQWHSNRQNVSGGSYFASLLSSGLSGYHTADVNKDLTVTINEAFAYLSENSAASTPQRYPQDAADFPLYCYSDQAPDYLPAISGLTFEDTLLSVDQSDVRFSFTVHRHAQLYYQLVYYKEGKWDFENASFFQDIQEGSDSLSPGRKQRTLHLDTANHQDSGYVMLQLFSMEGDIPVFLGGRLLCVQPSRGEVQLQVNTADGFDPFIGEEISILVTHDIPCALSVTVRNTAGKAIRRLAYAQPTRPLQLPSQGTLFYWDGKDNQGLMADLGLYYVQVQTTIGGNRFTAESDYFHLDTIIEE